MCPGRYIAERTVLLYAASVLAMYNIVPYDGQAMPTVKFGDGVIRLGITYDY
jgi:hypothetical protein